MKKILWSFLGAFLFLGMPFWVSAQEEEIPPLVEGDVADMINKDEYNSGDDNLVLIARVELYDAEILSQENNKFKMAFRLVNEGDIQPQIKYAIVLTNKEGLLIHQSYYDEMLTLGAGQELKKEIVYEAPLGINGQYNLNIIASNLKGLTLALGGFGEVNIEGEGLIRFDECYIQIGEEKLSVNSGADIDAENEKPVLKCEVFNESSEDITAKGFVQIRERSMFGNEVKKEELNEQIFKAKEKSSLAYNLFLPERPQAYDGELTLKSGDATVSLSVPLHYVIRGDSATIQNISLDKDDYESGETIKINLMVAGDADDFPGAREESRENQDPKLFADIVVYDGDNQKCAEEKTFEVDESKPINVLNLKTDTKCHNPNISLKLRNSEGKILDENDFSFKTVNEKVSPTGTIKNLAGNTLVRLFFALGFILIVVTIITVLIKNKKSSFKILLFLVLFGGIFFLGSDNAKAATYSGTTVNNGGVEQYTITYSLSASNINQGGSITAYSRLQWYGCLNATRHTVSSFAINSGGWYNYTSNVDQNTHNWAWTDYGLKSQTFSGINSVGTNTVKFRVTGRRYYSSSYDNQKDSDGKYVCLRCDQNTSYQSITPNAASCACYDHLFTTDLSLTFNVIAKVNGACNYTRARAYTAAETAWAGTSWCTSAPGGISNQPTSFLGYGQSVTWQCLGSGGGANASCPASRAHLVVATCGTRAATYPASATAFPALTSTSWCSLGTAEFPNGAISFPADGTSTPYWTCRGSNGSVTTDDKINVCRATSSSSPIVNGACNPNQAKIYSPSETTWADGVKWCNSGTVSVAPASFPGYSETREWICNASNGTDSPPCIAERKYDYPDVTLSLNPLPPYVISYDENSEEFVSQSITLTTKINNVSDACGVTGCNCEIKKDGNNLSYFKIDSSTLPVGIVNTNEKFICGEFNYQVSCNNAEEMNDPLRSEKTVGTGLVSSTTGTSVGTCKKICGDEDYKIMQINNNCSTSFLSANPCNNPNCPSVGQPIEVR